jgi:hypothetical protein
MIIGSLLKENDDIEDVVIINTFMHHGNLWVSYIPKSGDKILMVKWNYFFNIRVVNDVNPAPIKGEK